MKLKDALVGLLFWIGILTFLFVVMSLESWPMWALFVLSIVVWAIYILVVIRDHERAKRALKNPVLWMTVEGEDGVRRWTAMDGSGRTKPLNSQPPHTQPIYDQEAHN